MKYYIFVLGLLLTFVSCKTDETYKKTSFEKGDAIFSMKIEDPNNSYIKIRSFGVSKHIDMGENNFFTDTIKSITEGYYTFSDRMHACGFYVKPNSNIHAELNTRDFIRTIEFTGDNVKENNYLKDFFLQKRDLGRKMSIQHLAYLDQKEFIHLLDSIKNIRLDLLNKHNKANNLDKHFNYLEENRLFYEFASRMETYEAYRQYALQDSTFKVTPDFYDYRKNVEFENEDLIVVPSFHYYLESYYQKMANTISEKDSTDVYTNYLKVVGEKVQNQKIKERLFYSYAIQNLKETRERVAFFKEYRKFAKDTSFVKEIANRFKELNRLNPGEEAPEFEIPDVNGNIVKLSDFKGKYVYIDIWATWCAPCVKQMPFLDKLKEKYKDDITFIGISTDGFKGTWEKFLKVNNVKGIQLHSGDDETFKDLYKAHSVPQFILINPEGNITTAIAPKPSETETIEMIFDRIVEWNNKKK
jgi:thiol-disulfide isomerase/thioredoxin